MKVEIFTQSDTAKYTSKKRLHANRPIIKTLKNIVNININSRYIKILKTYLNFDK